MKKRTINAFTLVEMLIVIVIIGILIAALMPRMQAAQGRARDVSRKTALSQIQSAIVTSQGDKGAWPGMSGDAASNGVGISYISGELVAAGMNSIPQDPLKNDVAGLGTAANGIIPNTTSGDYGYIVTTRNGSAKGGFVLMAQTEVEGGSNWVYCGDGNDKGQITGGTDISSLTICQTITKDDSTSATCVANTSDCKYTKDSELRYIVIY